MLYNGYNMTLHLLLDILVAISIVLALSNKYVKLGLLLVGLGFLAEAIFSYIVDKDIVLGAFETLASFSALYDYNKAMRHNFRLTKKAKLIAAGVFVLLGIWYAAMGTLSPFLIAGVAGLIVAILEW